MYVELNIDVDFNCQTKPWESDHGMPKMANDPFPGYRLQLLEIHILIQPDHKIRSFEPHNPVTSYYYKILTKWR